MRLIDADALIEDIRIHSESYFADDFAHEWVDQQPTIDPVRKGKWMRHFIRPGVYADLYLHCSECGFKYDDNWNKWKYCPGCGVKMEECERHE